MESIQVMMWVTLITANIQMFSVEELGPLKYFGFVPWAICGILILVETKK